MMRSFHISFFGMRFQQIFKLFVLPYSHMKSSKAVLSAIFASSISLLPSMALAAPSIGSVQYAPNPMSGSSITLSANVNAASGIKNCHLYIDSDDKGEMNVSGNTASIQYNFAYAGVYTLFVFCRDNSASFASGPNTSIYVQGAQTQPTSGPFTGNPSNSNTNPQAPIEQPVQATQTTPITLPEGVSIGTLVKTECPSDASVDHACKAVYYVGKDGKRHGFPNSKVFFTWYTNFDGVQVISATQMSAIPLGKNVTYRPGTRMVKFTTLNKVYAVSKGGMLRWIASEPVAVALYGETWAKQIDDIPDTFYTDYTFGADINQSGDYLVTSEQGKVLNIDDTL